MAGETLGNEEDMAMAASSDLSVVCPNVMCDGVIPLNATSAHGPGVFSCPRCHEVFRLGSDTDMEGGTVDLRLTDLDRPGARPRTG